MLLTDRGAVVTGAAPGSARPSRPRFARFGADVAICDRDADGLDATAAEIEAAGRHAHAELLDVRDGDAVRAWIAHAAIASTCSSTTRAAGSEPRSST